MNFLQMTEVKYTLTSKINIKIRVIVYPVSFQKSNEIVQIATDFANNKFRQGEYNLITKNCQHFARLCIIEGVEGVDVGTTDLLFNFEQE